MSGDSVHREGGCLCGAVRVSARVEPGAVNACHCVQCQKWTGGGAYMAIPVQDLSVTGTTSVYHASEWGERAFCPACGTTLWWTMRDREPHTVAVGLFDDQSGFAVASEIFTDDRACWMQVWPDAVQKTGDEVRAEFGGAA